MLSAADRHSLSFVSMLVRQPAARPSGELPATVCWLSASCSASLAARCSSASAAPVTHNVDLQPRDGRAPTGCQYRPTPQAKRIPRPGSGGLDLDAIHAAAHDSLVEKYGIPENVPLIINPRGFRPGSVHQDVFFQSIPFVLEEVPEVGQDAGAPGRGGGRGRAPWPGPKGGRPGSSDSRRATWACHLHEPTVVSGSRECVYIRIVEVSAGRRR